MTIKYDFGGDEEFEHEPSYKDLQNALVKIMCKDVEQKQKILYNEDGAYQMAMYVVHDLDVVDALCECLEDELYEYFEDDARTEYENACANAEALQDWYGTMSDVRGI